ncbi:swr complex subunit [Trifolium repens]|nr:swr complex subunit [Trifolium repens]
MWFEEKRAEEGVPERRLPYQHSAHETEETNELLDLCERFDLRVVVIADRFPSSRTVEELKDRYYSVLRAILLARVASFGNVASHPLIKDPYNVSQEMERKRALSMVLSQTRKKMEEVLIEAKRIAELRMASKVYDILCVTCIDN